MTSPPKSIFLLQSDDNDGIGYLYSRIIPGCGRVMLAWGSLEQAESALDVDGGEAIVEYRPVKRRKGK